MKFNPCPKCKDEMILVSNKQLNVGLLLILILVGVLPGIIYYMWVKGQKNLVCLNCSFDFIESASRENKKNNNHY